jgi:hypothetical protein
MRIIPPNGSAAGEKFFSECFFCENLLQKIELSAIIYRIQNAVVGPMPERRAL